MSATAIAALALTRASIPAPAPGQTGCTLVTGDFGPRGTVPIHAERVVGGLEVPWSIAFVPETDAMIVSERSGHLTLVRGGASLPIAAKIPVDTEGESGLLGIALHPLFSAQRFLYVYYTTRRDRVKVNRVDRYRLADDLRSAVHDRVIVDGIPAGVYHDGGRLRFGPDGMLYVGTGDARDPPSAQSVDGLSGKILRVTPEGRVPGDNPTAGRAAFVRGIRNTQAFAWWGPDTLVVADHGPSGELDRTGGDEVSFAGAGANLGWPDIWGCAQKAGMTAPALVWKDAAPPGGAALYNGDKIPAWKGSFLIGTLRSKHLHRVILGAESAAERDHAIGPTRARVLSHEVYFEGDPPAGFGRLRDVVEGPDGYLYVTTSNCDGRGKCPAEKDAVLRLSSE